MVDQTNIFDFIEDDNPPVAAVEKPTFTPRSMKFKAWDTEEKRWMNHSFTIQRSVLDLEQNNSRFIVVQGTGVLDKNGREVYDGSIIDVTYYKQQLRSVVYYDAARGQFVTRNEQGEETYTLGILASCGWTFEVVGHVLETKG